MEYNGSGVNMEYEGNIVLYKQWCANGTLDDSKYTSPMPVIGLYIAISSLACFLSMLYDVLCAIRSRKPWVPCQFFSLNSLTLTLLAISTKLPVDLTTKMPSSQDQLSKLTGTAFICICMGYFMPSLGTMRKPEGLSNMAALTIFVITVAVNICIQIQTGVIFSFITEHMVILFCMLVLLVLLWYSMLTIDSRKSFCMDCYGELLIEGSTTTKNSAKSMKQRFRECYIHSYGSNPQLVILQTSHSAVIGAVCLLCTCLILKAVFGSLKAEKDLMFLFCKGISDYGKLSVWMVVGIQILNVLAGTILTNFRWLTLAFQLSLFNENHLYNESFVETYWYWVYESEIELMNLRLGTILRIPTSIFKKVFRVIGYFFGRELSFIRVGFMFTEMSIVLPFLTLKLLVELPALIAMCLSDSDSDIGSGSDSDELRKVVYSVQAELQKWIVRKGVEDMERWIALNKRNPPNHLNHLLLQTRPSLQGLLTKDIHVMGKKFGNPIDKDAFYTLNVRYKYRVSCLSMVILVLIAAVSLPTALGDLLIHALDEIFDTVYFIDQKMNVAARYNNKMICSQAKTLWINRKETIFLLKMKFFEYGKADQLDLDGSLMFIEKLKGIKDRSFTLSELRVMGCFIQSREYTSIEELGNHIKQTFVDMLHYFLPMFPKAILKDVGESPVEECEERVRVAMKLLCKFELMEERFQWVFPAENNITCLITSQLPTEVNPSKSTTQVEGSVEVSNATIPTADQIDNTPQVECRVLVTNASTTTSRMQSLGNTPQVEGSVVVSITEHLNSNAQAEDSVVVSTSAADHPDSTARVENMVLVPMNTTEIGYVGEIEEAGPKSRIE